MWSLCVPDRAPSSRRWPPVPGGTPGRNPQQAGAPHRHPCPPHPADRPQPQLPSPPILSPSGIAWPPSAVGRGAHWDGEGAWECQPAPSGGSWSLSASPSFRLTIATSSANMLSLVRVLKEYGPLWDADPESHMVSRMAGVPEGRATLAASSHLHRPSDHSLTCTLRRLQEGRPRLVPAFGSIAEIDTHVGGRLPAPLSQKPGCASS